MSSEKLDIDKIYSHVTSFSRDEVVEGIWNEVNSFSRDKIPEEFRDMSFMNLPKWYQEEFIKEWLL